METSFFDENGNTLAFSSIFSQKSDKSQVLLGFERPQSAK